MIAAQKKAGTAELLFKQALLMGLNPTWLTPMGLFVISTPHGERYINQETSSLNSHNSTSLSQNKYYTRLILGRNNLPNIPFMRPLSQEDAQAFLDVHGTIIVKPTRGSGSKNITIVRSSAQLQATDIKGCILEKYIAGKEMRYLVLNGAVIGVHESKYGTSVAHDRYLERISFDAAEWNPELMDMSLKVTGILGLSFACVDYLIDESGRHYVLEVNSCPGFKWFHAPSTGPSVDVAKLFLEAMLYNIKPSPDFASPKSLLPL